jgi:hypothetical protein
MEEIKTLISAFAIGISLASLYFARRSWMQSNRPIVTALIAEHASGNMGAVFNLIVSNTGNRPATNVRLHAKQADINKLIAPSAGDEKRKPIHACFGDDSMISVLKNGEELTTAFGSISQPSSKDQCLNYGAEITIEITYNDLEGKLYKSKVPIKVHARQGFGGAVWN